MPCNRIITLLLSLLCFGIGLSYYHLSLRNNLIPDNQCEKSRADNNRGKEVHSAMLLVTTIYYFALLERIYHLIFCFIEERESTL